MTQDKQILTPTKEDREAARSAFLLYNEAGDRANSLLWGHWDDHPLIQAFARHAASAREQALEEAASLARRHKTNGKRMYGINSRYDDAVEEIAAAIEALKPLSPTPVPEERASDEDDLVFVMLNELHANVPEADRPMGFCDLSDDQAARARAAIRAIIAALQGVRS